MLVAPIWAMFAYLLVQRSVLPQGDNYSHQYNLVIFANFAFFVLIATPRIAGNDKLARVSNGFGRFAYTTYLVHYPPTGHGSTGRTATRRDVWASPPMRLELVSHVPCQG